MVRPDTRRLWNANARRGSSCLVLASMVIAISSTRQRSSPCSRLLPGSSGSTSAAARATTPPIARRSRTRCRRTGGRGCVPRVRRLCEPRSIRFVLSAGADLPFRSSIFDFVTAFMSLMDVGEPERTLQEIGRVLKPGGFV